MYVYMYTNTCVHICIYIYMHIYIYGHVYIYLKAYALPPTLNWGLGLNGLHIESCLVCLAFMVDY